MWCYLSWSIWKAFLATKMLLRVDEVSHALQNQIWRGHTNHSQITKWWKCQNCIACFSSSYQKFIDDNSTHVVPAIYGYFQFFFHCIALCFENMQMWNILISIHPVQQIKTACQIPMQACFNSAEPLSCFRNTLCVLLRHMPPSLRHISTIDNLLIMQWQSICQRETVFDTWKWNRVMITFSQNKGCIELIFYLIALISELELRR